MTGVGTRFLARNVTRRQLLLVVGLYALFALFYAGSLSVSSVAEDFSQFGAAFAGNLDNVLVDYGFKLLLTIPVWYVFFQRLSHWSLWQKLVLHLVTLPLFVFGWQALYYQVADAFDLGRLRSNARIWDTYITMLFYLMQFGLFHASAYYRNYQKQREREAALRELTLKSELAALKAQLNPHFLYNVFNTISASVPPAQEHTREMLAHLSDMFRYQLQASKSETVPVRDELNFVMKYLDLEKARFGDRLRVRLAVADDVMGERIPPMMLQPLVENSVKHGIAPLIEGGEVSIRIERHHNQLHVEVTDTGVGLKAAAGREPSGGVGLANTVLRLDKMYGSQLQLSDNQPSGLKIAFSIPL